MSKCRGKCTAGVPSRSMLPRQRPRTAGSGIPQYSQTRIARPALMPPPQASRPRSALPVARRPPQGAPRGLPVQRRPASNIPVPFSRGAGASSRIPCPRRIGIAQPSVTINAARSRGNDININIRLSIEPPDEELEEFERLEREMEELEEFERMERQCELECSNSAQVYDAVPVTPAAQRGRYGRAHLPLIAGRRELGTGTARATRRHNQMFDTMAASAAGADIAAYSPPPFESPPDLSMGSAWERVGQAGSMLMDESMMDNTFDRAMLEDTFDNQAAWNQLTQDASGYDLGNVSFNYESPGCC